MVDDAAVVIFLQVPFLTLLLASAASHLITSINISKPLLFSCESCLRLAASRRILGMRKSCFLELRYASTWTHSAACPHSRS